MKAGQNRVRIYAVMLAMVMTIGTLTGCGMGKDGAQEYVQAALDAGYKGELNDYVRVTNSTKEEARQLYEGNIDVVMASLGLKETGVSEEMKEKYRELLKDIFEKEKYTVKDAKETEEGFEVPVKTEQMQMFDGLEKSVIEKAEKEIEKMEKVPDENQINEIALETMYEILSKRVEHPSYGEADTVTVHVKKDKEGVWYLSEEDLRKVDEALIK